MICGIILAAGDSSRMGKPKALLEYRDGTFLESICKTMHAAGIYSVTAVLGAHADEIRKKWHGKHEHALVNPNPSEGPLSSVQIALRNMPVYAGAAVVAQVDQPMVSCAVYKSLVETWRKNPGSIVIPKFKGKRGNPVLLDAKVWPLCFEAPPEHSLEWITRHKKVSTVEIDVADETVVMDIDTPEQYAALLSLKSGK